jgi:hypothetical protein
MSTPAQSVANENPFASVLGVSSLLLILFLAFLLRILGVSLAMFALILGAAALLWIVVRHPIGGLGGLLAIMSVFPLAIVLGEYFGPPSTSWASACSRILLVLLIGVLWRRNGVQFTAPDWFALGCFALALLRLAFGGTLISLLADFNCMIAYAAGRMTVLTADQEQRWARRAVWIVAVLAVLGMSEVFIFGEGPRAMLYSSVADLMTTEGGSLNAVFHADGFAGLRESATMLGPLTFGSLCMVGLILWWVYHRNPIPAVMIAAGLVCSVTRSAWLGTILAIPVLAVLMKQRRRFFLYAGLGLTLFIASIPVLGLSDYLMMAKAGQDYSTQGHEESILKGLDYMVNHPFGSGPGNSGFYANQNNSNGLGFESTYLTFAAEYGIPATLCFVGFLVSALWMAWRLRTRLGYAAVGILVGFGAVMTLAPLHLDFPLATWIWFPVGLAVRSSMALQDRESPGHTAMQVGF